MRGLKIKVLVIIPAYNEENSVSGVVKSLCDTVNGDNYTVDYIVVNDCSTDSTEGVCRENGLRHVSLRNNLGIGGGVQTGYIYALEGGYDIAVQMDGDGQHDPVSLDDLVMPIISGDADMTVGSRFLGMGDFFSTGMRRIGIRWLRLMVTLVSGVRIKDVTSGYRAVGRELISHFACCYPCDYPEPETIAAAAKMGYRIAEVPVIMHFRNSGRSSIRALKCVYYIIKVTAAILIGSRAPGRRYER